MSNSENIISKSDFDVLTDFFSQFSPINKQEEIMSEFLQYVIYKYKTTKKYKVKTILNLLGIHSNCNHNSSNCNYNSCYCSVNTLVEARKLIEYKKKNGKLPEKVEAEFNEWILTERI